MPSQKSSDISLVNDHGRCIICGSKNPWSLRLSFNFDGTAVSASFMPHPGLQGYTGIVHGGVISALLDSAMTNCLFHHGVKAVTGELTVKFIHSLPCSKSVNIKAWIKSFREPLYIMKSELSLEGVIMAWSEAKFMRQ